MQVIDLLDRTARSPVTARPEDTLQTAATLLAILGELQGTNCGATIRIF